VVERAKTNMFVQNPTADLLDSYVLADLENARGGHPSYIEQFEGLYKAFAGGKVLEKIKESLQRVINFKIYHLMFEGLRNGKIAKEEAGRIPASTHGKVDLLRERGILTSRESEIVRQLSALTYKLRFLGEVYAPEARAAEVTKVGNIQFRVEDLSYAERERLFGLLRDFKTEVLYK